MRTGLGVGHEGGPGTASGPDRWERGLTEGHSAVNPGARGHSKIQTTTETWQKQSTRMNTTKWTGRNTRKSVDIYKTRTKLDVGGNAEVQVWSFERKTKELLKLIASKNFIKKKRKRKRRNVNKLKARGSRTDRPTADSMRVGTAGPSGRIMSLNTRRFPGEDAALTPSGLETSPVLHS